MKSHEFFGTITLVFSGIMEYYMFIQKDSMMVVIFGLIAMTNLGIVFGNFQTKEKVSDDD